MLVLSATCITSLNQINRNWNLVVRLEGKGVIQMKSRTLESEVDLGCGNVEWRPQYWRTSNIFQNYITSPHLLFPSLFSLSWTCKEKLLKSPSPSIQLEEQSTPEKNWISSPKLDCALMVETANWALLSVVQQYIPETNQLEQRLCLDSSSEWDPRKFPL